jgi:hypothetical protein
MAIAGRVAIVPKGDWSADATYKRLDAVTYNNTLYFAKKGVPAGTATSNTEYWSKSIVGGASAIATTEDVGVVKPDGKSMSVDESGTLSINLDGTTITLDEAKNVIKLADTLKEKIGSALQPESIVNNQVTTEAGFALDARQANPNIDGTLAKKVSDLNGSLNQIMVNISDKLDTSLASGSCAYIKYGKIVIVYVSFNPKVICDNKLVLPAGTLPLPYQYMYHSVNGWGFNVAESLLAVNADGSMSFWCGEGTPGHAVYDSFVYMEN